jgi:thimet oligopeptidase
MGAARTFSASVQAAADWAIGARQRQRRLSAVSIGVITLVMPLAIRAADEVQIDQPSIWSASPDIAAFEQTENEHLAAAQRAIDEIVAAGKPKSIESVLVPFDEATRQLNAANYFATLMQQVHPDTSFRDHATAMAAKVGSAATALSLNRDVYQALASLEHATADQATQYYIKRQLLEFRLAGVDKDDATRAKLHRLQDRLTKDVSVFDRNISDDPRSVEVADAAALDGMPQDFIENHKPGADGKIQISTNYPDLWPILTFAKSADLRRRLWQAWTARAYPKNLAVLADMMQARYQIARILGYSSWADYNAADKMIRTGGNIAAFIEQLNKAIAPAEKREFAMMLAEKREEDPTAQRIFDYETFRYSELVRRSQYNFDSQSIRPYLPFGAVRQGILDTAATLFHVSFRQETGAPAWAPGVETWDVIENNEMIGRFYLDMHPRPGKYSHAQMAPVLDGVQGKQLPEAALVCNLPEPTASDPGLMSYADVVTFFHEFGHLMHHILGGQQRWAGISGISMEADFIEAPSQMLEEWMHSPQVLASFARHYKTGEVIPAELIERMNRASAFGRGGNVALQNALSAISYDIYKSPAKEVDINAVAVRDFRRYSLVAPLPSDAKFIANFDHLANYTSAYYTYMWDKVIAEDFFQQFDQQDLLAGETPMRYRRLVLAPGGSMSANDLVQNFLGRPQDMRAFQKWMDEEFSGAAN